MLGGFEEFDSTVDLKFEHSFYFFIFKVRADILLGNVSLPSLQTKKPVNLKQYFKGKTFSTSFFYLPIVLPTKEQKIKLIYYHHYLHFLCIFSENRIKKVLWEKMHLLDHFHPFFENWIREEFDTSEEIWESRLYYR